MLKRSFEYAKVSIFYLLIKHTDELKRKNVVSMVKGMDTKIHCPLRAQPLPYTW